MKLGIVHDVRFLVVGPFPSLANLELCFEPLQHQCGQVCAPILLDPVGIRELAKYKKSSLLGVTNC